jgi:hypothetical protein
MLKHLGGLVGWVSGSVAGLSAMLYAIGFLATKASDDVLGIGFDFTSQDHFEYVARGSSVIARTAILGGIAAVCLLGVVWLGRWVGQAMWLSERAVIGRVLEWVDGWVPVLCAIALLAGFLLSFGAFVKPAMDAGGLLFLTGADAGLCNGHPILRAVITQDIRSSGAAFNMYALVAGLILCLGFLIHKRLLEPSNRFWLVIGAIGVGLTILMTPVAYGILAHEKLAPEVELSPAPDPDPGRMRLLSRAGDGVLVWLEERHQVRWISKKKIEIMTVGREEPISAVACD